MALATRNLYLVLKARDEASRVVRGFGRELSRQGRLATAEMFRQRAAAISLAAAQRSLGKQQEVNSLRQRAALSAEAAAQARARGATQGTIDKHVLAARAFRRQAEEMERLNFLETKGAQLAAQQLRTQAGVLERQHRAAIRLSNALHTVSATWITVGSGIAIASAVGLVFLGSAVNVAKDYERQVRLTKTQVDGFGASLEQLSAIGLRVARTIAVPFEQIQPALYDVFSSTNANLKQSEILLRGFAKTAVAGQVSLQEASRGTIPILNAFNIPLEKVNDVLDIQFQLVRKGVGTYGEFARIFGRVVPSATRAGQSFQTVAAMLAFLTRNGLSAAMASTSAARALDAISHPKAVKAMEAMGIAVRDAAGNLKPLDQILSSLRTKLLTFPKAKRVEALTDIFKGAGGTIQARRFLEQVLLRPNELEEFKGFLNDMQNASGAFGQAYGQMAGSVAAQTELLRNRWKVLQEGIGKAVTPAFIVLVSWISKLIDKFNNLSPTTKKTIGMIILVSSVFGILAGVAVVVLGVMAGITAAIMAAGVGFFILTGSLAAVVVGLAAIGLAFYRAWKQSADFRYTLKQIYDAALSMYHDAFLPAARGIRQAYEEHIAPALSKLQAAIQEHVMPVLMALLHTFIENIIPAVREVANWIRVLLARAFEFLGGIIRTIVIPIFAILHKYYLDHKETIDQIIKVLIIAAKWFAKVAAVIAIVLVPVLVGPIVAILIAIIASFVGVAFAIIKVIEWIKALVRWFKSFGDSGAAAKQALASSWNAIVAFFGGVPGRIKNALGNLAGLLVDAGRRLIEGLMRGIDERVQTLKNKMAGVVGFIRGFFNGSPAKWGPLAGRGDMFFAGQEMMDRFAKGIQAANSDVAFAGATAAGGARRSLTQAPVSSPRTINQTINVNHVGQSAEALAAELGQELAGRM